MLTAVLAAVLAGPPAAVPDPPIVWDAPPGCPTLASVQDRVFDLLGRSLQPGELELRGAIVAAGTGWSLALTIKAGNVVDERSLAADDCAVLGEAAALVAVVMVDPVVAAATIETSATEEAEPAATEPAAAEPPDPARPDLPRAEPENEPAATPARPARPARDEPRRRTPVERDGVGVFLRARGGGEYGAMPKGTGGVGLALGIGTNSLRGEIEGNYWFGRDARADAGGANISLGSAAARVCGVIPAGPVGIPLCGGLEFGGMRANADAVAANDTTALWIALHAEAGVRWAFTQRLSLWASAQLFAPLRFPRFVLEPEQAEIPEQRVHQSQPAGVRGLLGLEVRLRGVDPKR